MFKLLVNAQKLNVTAAGIALQICDVFVQELNNVDKDASLEILVKILDPFLRALGKLTNGELKERINDNIFRPLLENNKTVKEESSDDEEAMAKKEKWHRTVDGGKLPPKTQKEIADILNTKYIFNSFNILIYAQNYILKVASETDTEITNEENREQLYKLYEYACQLEPKPDRDELTFSQQQLVNRARSFVTMKMKRRANLREQKSQTKSLIKMKHIMSDQLAREHSLIMSTLNGEEQEIEDLNDLMGKQSPSKHLTRAEKKKLLDDKDADKDPVKIPIDQIKIIKDGKIQFVDKAEVSEKQQNPEKKELEENKEGDVVMKIETSKKKKNKKKIKGEKKDKAAGADGGEADKALCGAKRVHFDLSQNQVTEFFKHGKVAQRVLEI